MPSINDLKKNSINNSNNIPETDDAVIDMTSPSRYRNL